MIFLFNFFLIQAVQSFLNKTDIQWKFQEIEETKNFIFLLVKAFSRNLSGTTFLFEYSKLNMTFTNKLCELAGFENFHSMYHLEILKEKSKVLLYKDFLPDDPLLYEKKYCKQTKLKSLFYLFKFQLYKIGIVE